MFSYSFTDLHCNASSLHTVIELRSTQQNTRDAKTEFFIVNNTAESIWILANGDKSLIITGMTLRLYSNEVEVPELRIKMSRDLSFSEPFFDQLVPNHTKLWVGDYLPKKS
ncbi:hypothetical protein Lmac_1197 [Legionella maceachernii]|uniref:Uncharacterized protein n=1 Tax=Legionella maceachernii TaxID=466 RepID=A0A0W0W565_9GAMM|nr:hypothetical protein Lmac_1197 [Legionella maceachernii]SKA27108.1 hypothetical protein SAMN02745128_02939 [Legionella maceachernii]SUP04569.1 Uncharacterised protein [Legionella maceachernii]